MIKKILIANRGEIAIRIAKTCKKMGIQSVGVFSQDDVSSLHLDYCDERFFIGNDPLKGSYLNIEKIIEVSKENSVDAIHPGVGLLSENFHFAKVVNDHGFCFIGPKSEHIKMMGNKILAKNKAREIGLPILPGSETEIKSLSEALKICEKIGFPVLIKATNGGGGRGIKKVFSKNQLKEKFTLAKSEALQSFGDDSIYIEKYLDNPRHIEIQIVSDNFGNCIHVGERDCSIQRRNQKLIEECPSPVLNDSLRQEICLICTEAMKKLNYHNVGTIEFLFQDNKFYFIEMNTRLQVEHPITELVYGIDIVKEQIKISSGKKISIKQKEINRNGHSIECRINAENPENFFPSSGKINTYHVPGGPGIRIDSALYTGLEISNYYDGLIAKLIIHGKDREECLMRLKRALLEFIIEGVDTTIPLYKKLIDNKFFIKADYNINWLQDHFL